MQSSWFNVRFFRFVAILISGLLGGWFPGSFVQSDEPVESGDGEFWQTDMVPFLQKYCADCHSGESAEADIDFDKYDSGELLAGERPRWNQVRGMIEIGAMPPADYDPLPEMEERERIAAWIDRKVNSVDCGVNQGPGRVTLRRLNNAEYDNTLRDLLGVDYSISSMAGFPSDGVGNGFDNQGDVLTLSPLQLEKYLQAARLAVDSVIVHDSEELRKQEKDVPALYAGDEQSVNFLFADGVYEVRARLEFEDSSEKRDIPVALLIDGEEVTRWNVTSRRKTFEIEQPFEAGVHDITLKYVEDPYSDKKQYTRRIEVDYIAMEGPKEGEPALPAAHRRLFRSHPSDERSVTDAAREIFEPLVRRAFRRKPEPVDVNRVVNLVAMAVEQGESFESAVGYGLQSLLVSPKFLFRIEGELDSASNANAGSAGEPVELLNDYALASRLSYFLWASMPDGELLDLAQEGKLADSAVLRTQVGRMLADARSEGLVSRFFGQFFGLGGLQEIDPDPDQFPFWSDALRAAMRKETEQFCRHMIDQDLGLDALLQADFTFVNPRLAELYGLEFEGQDPKDLYFEGPGFGHLRNRHARNLQYRNENRWIQVKLPENRRGVLTQAAVLTLTSNPTSTSPVKRGKWILESILGDPPPPAPPNVPGLEVTQEEHGDLSLREQLELHRTNPSCASCHRVMDPLGLGFENFDAVGRWRDNDGKHPIDAAGELADGRKFSGAVELVKLLLSRQGDIHRHFASKLLTYGLGRGLEPSDSCTLDEIVAAAAAKEYRLSSFVEAVVLSRPFRQRSVLPERIGSQ